MAFVEELTLADNFSKVRITADRDPADACPGGVVAVHIHALRAFGGVSLAGVDTYFELIDREDYKLPVGNNFSVFPANIDGARVETERTPNGHTRRYVSARIRLAYCHAPVLALGGEYHYHPSARNNPMARTALIHSPETHRADVLDTAEALAEFALAVTRQQRLPQLREPHRPL